MDQQFFEVLNVLKTPWSLFCVVKSVQSANIGLSLFRFIKPSVNWVLRSRLNFV